MMLSPQAARMGTVNTTIRQIGKMKDKLHSSSSSPISIHSRFKSTRAAAAIIPPTSFYDEDSSPHSFQQQHLIREPWMANLGRTDQNWLEGPRSQDWFTGVHPSACPGESPIGGTYERCG
jgi:hypothetical protein